MTTLAGRRFLPLTSDDRTATLAIAILVVTSSAVLVHSTGFALLAVVALLVLGAVQPVASVVAIPAAIGFVFQPIHIRTLEFSPQEVLIVTTLGGTGLNVIWKGVSQRSARGLLRVISFTRNQLTSIDAEAVLLVVFGTISLFTLAMPAYRHESLRDYRWVILEPVIYYALARWFLRDAGARRLALLAFVGGAVAVGLAGLVGLAIGHGGLSVEGVIRVNGVYPHPNALALFLERPFVVGLGLATVYRSNLRWQWLLPAGVIGLALLLTYSRGAVLAAGLAVVLVLLLGQRRRLAALATSSGSILLAILAVTASARIANLFSGGSGSLRFDLWESSLRMIRDHPVFGIGLDQFLYVYAPRYVKPQAWSERFTSHPHDIVLDVWLRLGIMGLVLALAYVFSYITLTVRLVRRKQAIGLAASGAIFAGILHGLVDNGYFLPDLALIFWFLTVLMVAEAQGDTIELAAES